MRLTRWEGRDADGPRAVTARRDGPFAPIMQEVLRKLAKYEDMEEATLKIKLDPGATMPTRAHETDAGLDLYAMEKAVIWPHALAGDGVVFDTGVHIELPHGYFGKIESKSGLNVKYGIVVCGGVIDEGYTGSIKVKLYNLGHRGYAVQSGDKIAQLVIQPYAAPEMELVAHLDETERGDNGFGSTGK